MGRRARPAEHHGVVVVDKPAGITSHDVVGRLRRIFGQRQVGHTGTLDPMATGLIVAMLGRATRLARFVEATDKTYEGTVRLGIATDTYDAEGEVIEQVDLPTLSPEAIRAAAEALTGRIEQQVPAFSAVKVDGERLYAKARRNEDVALPTREVEIHALEVTRIDGADVDIEVTVSKGTYIRSLAVQLGERLGVPAHLCRLRRTRVGRYGLAQACTLDDPELGPASLLDIDRALDFMPALHLDERGAEGIAFGRAPLPRSILRADGFEPGDHVRVVAPGGGLLAVAEAERSSDEIGAAPTQPPVRFLCVLAGR